MTLSLSMYKLQELDVKTRKLLFKYNLNNNNKEIVKAAVFRIEKFR